MQQACSNNHPRQLQRKVDSLALAALACALIAWPAIADAKSSWERIRISGSGANGWQPVVCAHGAGWQSCEMPITINLSAAPPSIPANGSNTTITATVTDYYGVSIGAGTQVNWTTSLGTLSVPTSETDENGVAEVNLQSVPVVGSATVTATSSEGGVASILIPFSDYWIAISSLYTAWANNGAPYNCSAWSPAASTVNAGTTFTQSAICNQAQLAYRQDRQQSPITGVIRNVGGPVPLSQVINVTAQQNATGTKEQPKPPEPTHPWTVCKFSLVYSDADGGSGYYIWATSTNGSDFAAVTWNTFLITGWVGRHTTQATFDGVTYYRGAWRSNELGADQYEVCR